MVVFGATLAYGITQIKAFSNPVPSEITRPVWALWVLGLTLAGGLLGISLLTLWIVTLSYFIFVVVWGLYFGLIYR